MQRKKEVEKKKVVHGRSLHALSGRAEPTHVAPLDYVQLRPFDDIVFRQPHIANVQKEVAEDVNPRMVRRDERILSIIGVCDASGPVRHGAEGGAFCTHSRGRVLVYVCSLR